MSPHSLPGRDGGVSAPIDAPLQTKSERFMLMTDLVLIVLKVKFPEFASVPLLLSVSAQTE